MLQSFLDIGLLPIGEDDQNFNYLKLAAQEVASNLLQNKSKILEYTLVALDPEVGPNNLALQDVEEAIKKHWSTFKNKFRAETPRQILRAIIIESLQIIGTQDEDAAAIIYLIGSSFLPYAKLEREQSLCISFLTEMGNLAESKAVSEWYSNMKYSVPRMPVLKLETANGKRPKVNQDKLTRELEAASGPQNQDGEKGQNANANWPQGNQSWAYHFAPRAAAGITNVMNQALAETLDYVFSNIGGFDKELTKHTEAIKTKIKESLNQILQSVEIQDRRNKLLWWRQTLYSPSIRQSYRSMDVTPRMLYMAYDLHAQVTPHAPQSVEYLLREAVCALSQENTKLEEIGELCEQITAIQPGNLPHQLGFESKLFSLDEVNRVPLVTFIGWLLLGKVTASSLYKYTGVKGNSKITREEFAVWIYRDLQAKRLAT